MMPQSVQHNTKIVQNSASAQYIQRPCWPTACSLWQLSWQVSKQKWACFSMLDMQWNQNLTGLSDIKTCSVFYAQGGSPVVFCYSNR